MSEAIIRLSKQVAGGGKKREYDCAVTGKNHFLMFNLYLACHHIPRTLVYFADSECATVPDLVRNATIRKHCLEIMDLVGWINTKVALWNVINLKTLARVRSTSHNGGFVGWSNHKFLAMLCTKAEKLWGETKKYGGVVCHHEGFELFPRVFNITPTQDWYPMYHYLLQKLNEDDILRVCTDGMRSSCLFIKDLSTKKQSGHAVFKKGKLNSLYVKYMRFHLCNGYANSKKISNLFSYPDGEYKGHVNGLCCNPYHYMDRYEKHMRENPIQWPTTTPVPNTQNWNAGEEHIANKIVDIRDTMNIPKISFYLMVKCYSERAAYNTFDTGHVLGTANVDVRTGLDDIVREMGHILGVAGTLQAMRNKAVFEIEADERCARAKKRGARSLKV